MKTTDELRETYLRFFEARGHRRLPSDSLVPADDPSLLFTGAGMNQFKEYFLGRGPDKTLRRATTSQKCLRTGDIERVGTTPAHQTFFEMLGNFSFGDYFKKEAITWAWEFVTAELRVDAERLYASVYTDDREALDLWKGYLPASRIYKFGAADNFWPANAPADGPNGPCGPCSEIYYDFGGLATCAHQGACAMDNPSCKRFVEIWNLVFTQFDRRDGGVLAPLPQRNIDTGMGLERLAAVMQGVWSSFDTDSLAPIVMTILTTLDAAKPRHVPVVRRMADHLRAAAFLIAEGVLPDREGRGYVLRRLLRSVIRDNKVLGAERSVIEPGIRKAIEVMAGAYPELREREAHILRIARAEEDQFGAAIEGGLSRFDALAKEARITGEGAFLLHGTYGFPIEMTEQMARDRGLPVDRAAFDALLEADRKQSRDAAKFGAVFESGPMAEIRERFRPTVFLGYRTTRATATVLATVSKDRLAAEAGAGAEVQVLLDQTPFYGEGGGQVGDAGWLRAPGVEVEVLDTQKPHGFHLHRAKVTKGALHVGAKVEAHVDEWRRLNIMRNHTGTHVLHAALRTVLGPHARQVGSRVMPERLTFDFAHPKALSAAEIRAIEDWCNLRILQDHPVTKEVLPIARAREAGAIMFFDEKYGEEVRVLTVGDFSKELCGGTHLDRTAPIAFLKVVSESSVGAGVRRIEAVTGPKAVEVAHQAEDALRDVAAKLGAPKGELARRLDALLEEARQLRQQIQRLKRDASGNAMDDLLARARAIGGEKVVVEHFDDGRPAEELRSLVDVLLKQKNVAAALVGSTPLESKPVFIVGVRPDVVGRGLKAGAIAKEIGKAVGAGGGGKDHLAQAGAPDEAAIPKAHEVFASLVARALGG